MREVTIFYYPDLVDPGIFHKINKSIEECFDDIRKLCEIHKDTLHRTSILAFGGGGLAFSIYGGTAVYRVADKYKDMESVISDICDTYFKGARARNKTKITTVEELRNTDVVIKGYTTPQDYDYGGEYSKKCKFCEAFEILKNVCETWPEEDSNLQFEFKTRDEEFLFWIRRDLETIYWKGNKFNLTKEMIRKALGMEECS